MCVCVRVYVKNVIRVERRRIGRGRPKGQPRKVWAFLVEGEL